MPAKLEVQLKHAWNNEDRSSNIVIKEDKLTFQRNTMSESTDCIRGRKGYTRGLHVWQIYWPLDERGTHAVVGVATEDAPLYSFEYTSLVGNNPESWGWNLRDNKLYHDSESKPGETYPAILKPNEHLMVQNPLLVVLDMDEGTLSYMVMGMYLGVAFEGLKGKKLYPIVSATKGNCHVMLRYTHGLDSK
ncbi:GUS protein, partial [Amia calva]|nr:GUS protein [Amia calva]